MIETTRLMLRPLSPRDEDAFLVGISDDELRRLYGFPAELSEDTARRIFAHFSSLPTAYGLVRKADEALVGFLLDVPSELPEVMLRSLPEDGRTLAFATFPPYQRQGYCYHRLAVLLDGYHAKFASPADVMLLCQSWLSRSKEVNGGHVDVYALDDLLNLRGRDEEKIIDLKK